ncbi:MAG: DUF389 domain-containing protein [Deltaproteobacteria bacterium]|nr:DUF389 domain-containing protein [Deltaproteobacteria bacterium]
MDTPEPSCNNDDRRRVRLSGSFSDPFIRTKRLITDSFIDLLSVTECRKETVREDITVGSTPKAAYYLLLGISVLIAGFGLLINSPAVVIGAMLVSPLMTPIFGISLGLVRGDMTLLRNALVAEFGGVLIAIGAAAILGLFPFAQEVTPEMLARTSPTLLDLLVAALAGTAGCLAMIDERISPVLPGIAMATSLVPPLAVSGLCIAFRAFEGAWGAFLLFFANFLAILAISAVLFIVAGFVSSEEMGSKLKVLKRFSGPVIGLIFVTILLTHALVGIVGDRRTTKAIEGGLKTELAMEPGTSVDEIVYKRKEGNIDILALVTTPRVLSPKKIKEMQDRLAQDLGLQTNLIMRCRISKDISSTGSTSCVVGRNLDGEFISTKLDPKVKRLQLAEQVLRELLEDYRGTHLDLDSLDIVDLPHESILVAGLQGSRHITPFEVAGFEKGIRERLEDPNVRLLIRSSDVTDISGKGRVLYGRAHFGKSSEQEAHTREKLEREVKTLIERFPNMFAPNIDAEKREKTWHVLAEVVGPRVLNPAEIRLLEKEVSRSTGQGINLRMWCRVELMVDNSQFMSVEGFTKNEVKKRLGNDPLDREK